MPTKPTDEQIWYQRLTEGEPNVRRIYHLNSLLPSSPRCKLCAAPFKGIGGYLMHLIGRDQSKFNPRFCDPCAQFDHPGGAEVTLTMFFADVRGSTVLAESMSAFEFSRLINRFYSVATDALVREDAMVDRLIGDEVVGLFLPGFAGAEHPRKAIQAAQHLLHATGHGKHGSPWAPVGIGIHTGEAYVGVVGGEGSNPSDFTALGDHVNITARLASQAAAGEILISEAAYSAAGLDPGDLERRTLELKGKSEPASVYVVRVEPD